MKGSITKKGNTYSVIIDIGNDKNGKRRQKWFSGYKTIKEAQRFLNKKIVEIEADDYILSDKILVSTYLNNWIDRYVTNNLSKTTAEGYTRIIEKHINPNIGHIELQRLKPIHIFKNYMILS